MGVTSPIADCLSAPDETFTEFFDPIVEAMMVSVMPILEPVCIALYKPKDIQVALDLAISIGLDFPELALDPLKLFELGGIDLPSILLGLDISMEIDIDVEFTLAALEIALGMLLIPINLVIGWAADLPKLPTLPTIDIIVELMIDLGFDPSIDLECVAEIIMIPIAALGAVLEGDDSICE
jgi:hypothetical protein